MAKGKVTANLENSVPAPAKSEDPMNDWEAKDHMNTLIQAHQIINDPVKMGKVHKLAGRHKKAITSIQDLKDHYNEAYGPKAEKKSLDTFKSPPKEKMDSDGDNDGD